VTGSPRVVYVGLGSKGHTALCPDDLLGSLKRIEQRMDRQPTVRYGPQPIHPDILFSGVTGGCLDFGSKAAARSGTHDGRGRGHCWRSNRRPGGLRSPADRLLDL
jgi:hypothetical protein